ncbi:MAG: hypothetical protein NC209_00525 [Alistipes sp.]|nr:hypothetical protein [Alistipes senegalensis]MCM1249617.1 hypothetical protein [Alistipes sp.]
MASSNNRQISRIDWIALVVFTALFLAWYLTDGRFAWLRYLLLGLMFFHLFVVRIVAHNYYKRKEESRFDGENKEQQ